MSSWMTVGNSHVADKASQAAATPVAKGLANDFNAALSFLKKEDAGPWGGHGKELGAVPPLVADQKGISDSSLNATEAALRKAIDTSDNPTDKAALIKLNGMLRNASMADMVADGDKFSRTSGGPSPSQLLQQARTSSQEANRDLRELGPQD